MHHNSKKSSGSMNHSGGMSGSGSNSNSMGTAGQSEPNRTAPSTGAGK
jgi:hypothetical protein